ncbi:MAG: DUF1501 domain-containing protein [Planctomycetales bacterium]|jgi:hypothetical protein
MNFERRSLLRSSVALSLGAVRASDVAGLQRASAAEGSLRAVDANGRAKSCVFIFLFGGPSHIDLWDMKPSAPEEIRGEFQPVSTSVPGIQMCEHLPLLGQQMHRFCLLRSMRHRMPVHGPACSEVYSGRPYFGPPITDQATPEDWPSIAAMVHRYGSGSRGGSQNGDGSPDSNGETRGGLPSSVVLPWYTQFVGQDRRIAGQTGGRMSEQFNPFLVEGNPKEAEFKMRGLQLPSEVTSARFRQRRELREQLDPFGLQPAQSTFQTGLVESNFHSAATLVENAGSVGAFDLSRESTAQRAKYGDTRFGQSLLMAQRLVESEVPLVTVNWDDDHKDDKVSPHWDTHALNFPKLKDRLCPVFDRAMSTFLQELDERGLLETTLVVALGEFGRTPKVGVVTQNGMTAKTGRDHWPHAFTAIVAGGGVRGGQVYGSTTANGGYVAERPVSPADLSATILLHLGIDPSIEYDDHFLQVRQRLSEGRPVDLNL